MKGARCVLVLWLALALPARADELSKREEVAVEKHNALILKATEAFWKAKLAADKSFAEQLHVLEKAPHALIDTGKISREAGAADQDVKSDLESLASHEPVISESTASSRVTAARESEERRLITAGAPPTITDAIIAHKLAIGMTLEQAKLSMRGRLNGKADDAKQISADQDSVTYEWAIFEMQRLPLPEVSNLALRAQLEKKGPDTVAVQTSTLDGTFKNGKLTFINAN